MDTNHADKFNWVSVNGVARVNWSILYVLSFLPDVGLEQPMANWAKLGSTVWKTLEKG